MGVKSVYELYALADILWGEYVNNPYLREEVRNAISIALDIVEEAASDPEMFLKIQKVLEEHSVEEEEDDC